MTDDPRRRDTRSDAERRMQESLGPEIGSDLVEAAGTVAAPGNRNRPIILALVASLVILVISFAVAPPFPPGQPDEDFQYPTDAITANFELPAPHVIFDLDPSTPIDHTSLVTFDATISSSLFTGWIIMVVIVVLAMILSRSVRIVPRGGQNALEYVYEGLANFATSMGGPKARKYLPVFTAFFLYILFCNWSGLLPGVGRTEQLRAPTSDVNITIGLALVAFAMFHIEGVRALGFRRYFGKFFTLKTGVIGLFVGLLEFLLEFVKPVTLSMRLFGNIYAGEIALGVITALTFVILPVAMFSLEVLLNFMQALIFSVLTLMFTLIAIESHDDHDEEHAGAAEQRSEATIVPEVSAAHA